MCWSVLVPRADRAGGREVERNKVMKTRSLVLIWDVSLPFAAWADSRVFDTRQTRARIVSRLGDAQPAKAGTTNVVPIRLMAATHVRSLEVFPLQEPRLSSLRPSRRGGLVALQDRRDATNAAVHGPDARGSPRGGCP